MNLKKKKKKKKNYKINIIMHNLVQLFRYPNAVQESFSSLPSNERKKKRLKVKTFWFEYEGQDYILRTFLAYI